MTTVDLHHLYDGKEKKKAHCFSAPSIGKQVESQRKSLPTYSFSRGTREKRHKEFISHEAAVTTSLCTHSPPGGPIYDIPSTLDVKEGRGAGFTKAASTDLYNIRPEDGINTNDELRIHVDSQPFKYDRDATILIGTDPRGKLKDAELIKNHSAAFFGRVSPGPVYGGAGGPNFKVTRPRMGMARPFGAKLPSRWQVTSDLPEKVGPGIYESKDTAVKTSAFKKQNLSHRINQPVNAFPHAAKFPKGIDASEAVSKLEAATSAFGRQGLSKNRSEPTVGFGRGTRNSRDRTAVCMTKDDQGPKAFMPKFQMSMPRLPMEVDIMKAGHMA
jgi:hypothetical protein